jgi:hypothetical protein
VATDNERLTPLDSYKLSQLRGRASRGVLTWVTADVLTALLDAAERAVRLEAELEVAISRSGIKSKMLRYIAFVLTGDENADVQLAADRVKSALAVERERVAQLEVALARMADEAGYKSNR